ncbi:hypothetical protein [Cesiribacter sp. SM1]|uniref:hypothetical protein n=1 Tax=Cesiribacter sp. SM1 TaxID=2861196 RepID=UPI001CD2EF48|nr:hypothetical protein [Cesiribacter sp. SM1]
MKDLIEKNASVIHDKVLNCLHARLSGFISYDDLVRVLKYEFKMVEYYKLKKCIIDLTGIKVYPSGGGEYVKDVWFPQMERNGVNYIAFIVPENVFGEASMQKAHDKVEEHKNLQTRNFTDEASAKSWIEEQKVAADVLV